MTEANKADEYLTPEALRNVVAESIARVELDRHQVDIAVLMHGDDVQIREGESADAARERLTGVIEAIKAKYGHLLVEETA